MRRARTTSTATASSSARARASSSSSAEHAAARGARVYARLAGVGLSSDAYHITSPDPEGRGQVAAMRRALEEAGVTGRDVVHVNAHATSTKVGDLTETRSIRSLLGDDADHVLLSATKSMTGHLLGGAGALESIFTIKAVAERLAPPTINVANPDPELQVPLVRTRPRRCRAATWSRSTTRSASGATTSPSPWPASDQAPRRREGRLPGLREAPFVVPADGRA